MFKKIALLGFTAMLVMMLVPAVVLKAAGEYEGPAIQIGDTVPAPTTIPDGKIVMPDLSGMNYKDAEQLLNDFIKDNGLNATVAIGWAHNSDPAKNLLVIQTDPLAGEEVDPAIDHFIIMVYEGYNPPAPTGANPTTAAQPTTAAKPTTVADPAGANPTTAAKPTGAQVTKAPQVSLVLDKKSATVVCGKNTSLKATLKESTAKITWKSSNNKIATVDSKGKITAKMAGAVTVTATAAGKSAECVVTVLYKDVINAKDFWYAPTNYLTAKGVVKGYDKQTLFKPANNCTRAQMVTFIWRLQGEPAPKAKTCKFSDVKATDYFYKACIWGNENHIVEGYKDGTFGPQIVCARKHAVTFLWRLAGKPKTSAANKFSDVKKSDYFYTPTIWASEQNILAGYSDGTFRPEGDCLRRQMVTFLYKYDKFVNEKAKSGANK